MDELANAVLCGADDLLLFIQRWFCRHKSMIVTEYAVICEKCGKHIADRYRLHQGPAILKDPDLGKKLADKQFSVNLTDVPCQEEKA